MLAAESGHQARELDEREPRVAARAAVAGERDDAAVDEPERGPRMAPVGRIGVELVGRSAEALGVGLRVVGDVAVDDEQRAGLQQVAARLGVEVVAARDPGDAALNVHARANRVPRRVERHVLADHAVRAHLAQWRSLGPGEEAADQRLSDAAAGAPRLEALLARQHGDADLGVLRVVAGDVDRRPGAPGEEKAPAVGVAVSRRECRDGGGRSGHGVRVARCPGDRVITLLPGVSRRSARSRRRLGTLDVTRGRPGRGAWPREIKDQYTAFCDGPPSNNGFYGDGIVNALAAVTNAKH